MRVLLSTIGSRGDVQPVVALARRLGESGQEVRVCAPPDFGDWIGGLGIGFTPVGPELRGTAKPGATTRPSPEQVRRMIEGTVAAQFAAVAEAAEGCDVLVACGALQVAARSIAERRGMRYAYAAYVPVSLPSPHHSPPVLSLLGQEPANGPVDHGALWEEDARHWNTTWGPALNAHRAAAGQEPVTDVRGHVFTDRPWLAADPVLAPWPGGEEVVQTGAWVLPDERPLSAELEAFLDAGEPPVYFGFGSMRAPDDLARTMVESARALGRRAVVSRGWADLSLVDGGSDCLSIGEVNQQALFRRVAAVVHHGGAGTTTAATGAGAPQVVVPQVYDQHYFAGRVRDLGIGSAHPPSVPTIGSLTAALADALRPEVAVRARAVEVRADGAAVAAGLVTAQGT
ncbi:glycosyltransferase [Umezawaea endophytica]|uniref:Glycosyltransferase n=1 Tax=Umezawaea endophytica TaxID=1654476 RepID=A0A9X2VNP0_9PSEU|nr:glycosyltransferase [Umezawaea endophytica]MCS7479454.1 glycosyltransferase [Umezawaea endophytica]